MKFVKGFVFAFILLIVVSVIVGLISLWPISILVTIPCVVGFLCWKLDI
jgi:hypothetical protein